LLKYSVIVELPFCIVARARRVFTTCALVCDENNPSISLHAAAAVALVAIGVRVSFEREERMKLRTCWSCATQAS
jgi:hypothetical protein